MLIREFGLLPNHRKNDLLVRRFKQRMTRLFDQSFPLPEVDEFRLWTQAIKPLLVLPVNVQGIWEYGFTEVLNNAIDHARARQVHVEVNADAGTTCIIVADDGVGVFARLRDHFGFDSEVHALIELIKGKLTVAPEAHSGEGLFFSSQAFDRFSIRSGELNVNFSPEACTVAMAPAQAGTRIEMCLANDSPRVLRQVFDHYCGGEDYSFFRTRFLMPAAAIEGALVSRSQARRVAARFESFQEVEIDFRGVAEMGQAFADELFRVWPAQHPQTRVMAIHSNSDIDRMIRHVRSRSDLPQPGGLFN